MAGPVLVAVTGPWNAPNINHLTSIGVTTSLSLVWSATGAPISSLWSYSGGNLRLPAVDQPGFVDTAGNPVTGWNYGVTASWVDAAGNPTSDSGPIRVYAYQATTTVYLKEA